MLTKPVAPPSMSVPVPTDALGAGAADVEELGGTEVSTAAEQTATDPTKDGGAPQTDDGTGSVGAKDGGASQTGESTAAVGAKDGGAPQTDDGTGPVGAKDGGAPQTDDGTGRVGAEDGGAPQTGESTGLVDAEHGGAPQTGESTGLVGAEDAQKMLAEIEERQFTEAEAALRQAIQDIPELQQLAESLIIERTRQGLRIQIVDQEKYTMFPKGSSKMHDTARTLMAHVVAVVKKLPQKISITGHTDATPYINPEGYDNWDLSTDRANSSRRALIDSGLPAGRIVDVTGKADQEPLVTDDPFSPRNRRISIVLLREQKPVASD
jgi:chemotaxis protein MotB